jgi:hypothetical protein
VWLKCHYLFLEKPYIGSKTTEVGVVEMLLSRSRETIHGSITTEVGVDGG